MFLQDESALFPSVDKRVEAENLLTRELASHLSAISYNSASPTNNLEDFRTQLLATDFEESRDLESVVSWVLTHMSTGQVQMTHTGCFGLYNPSPTFPSECADRIAAAFNPQVCVWSHAPVPVEIESHVIEQLIKKTGLPLGATGHFTSGGSEANNTAVICALTSANSNYPEKGIQTFTGQPCIYVSTESHLAWLKIAHQAGLGREAVRLVATDGAGRMCTSALANQIEHDISAGRVPIMVAATAGTTNAGMIDPLEQCAAIATRYSLWYHIDAAWAGALVISPIYRHALAGIELADSITIDAHKWFAVTMGAGMFLTSHSTILNKCFRVSTSYMPSSEGGIDYYTSSMLWSRRFVGLRLFLSLAVAGWQGYINHLNNGVELIQRLVTQCSARGWQHLNSSPAAVACLLPPSGKSSVQNIVEKVVATGESWISVVQFEGQSVIRVCITNGRSSAQDVDNLINAMTLAVAQESN